MVTLYVTVSLYQHLHPLTPPGGVALEGCFQAVQV